MLINLLLMLIYCYNALKGVQLNCKYLDELSYPVVLIDNSNKLVWANKKFYLLHKTLFSINDEVLINRILIDNIIPSITSQYTIKDAASTYKINKSQVTIESKKQYLLSFFDISKYINLVKKTSKKQLLFETLSEHLPEGIVLHNKDLIEYTNPTFEILCGFNNRELKSKNILDLIVKEDQSHILSLLKSIELNEIKKFDIKTRILNKKNKEVWVKIKSRKVINEDQSYFLSIITDISKEKNIEEKLVKIANFDALTGLYNRRKFDEILKLETNRVKRYKRDLSALFFDIDHFKKVNDTYGHDIGDDVLMSVAKLVLTHIRETDYFARWGGEEFIIILPETNIDKAKIMAENIRKEIESHIFNKAGHLTVSIGVSNLIQKERVSTFLKRLDTALYKAKNSGRNCTIVL